jgi:hypothetical protein
VIQRSADWEPSHAISLIVERRTGDEQTTLITSVEPPGADDYRSLTLRHAEAGRDGVYAYEDWVEGEYWVLARVGDTYETGERTEFYATPEQLDWTLAIYVINPEPMDISAGDDVVLWGVITEVRSADRGPGVPQDVQVLEVDYWRPAVLP